MPLKTSRFLDNNKGIGSFFSHVDSSDPMFKLYKSTFYPKNGMFFYTGRQAIKYVIESIKPNQELITIWLPNYYCKHVTHWIRANYSNTKLYDIDPKSPSEVIQVHKFANENDIVLINNFCGISDCNYNKGDKYLTIIEDHSHGWLSNACIHSKADFCIASLRKSVPVPLGGLAWRPDNHQINSKIKTIHDSEFLTIWDNILRAMNLKKSYEIQNIVNNHAKSIFLEIIRSEEEKIHSNYHLVTMQEQHRKIIENYLSINFLSFKKLNWSFVKPRINPSIKFECLDSSFPGFGLILYLDKEEDMNTLRNYLIKNNIYPALLWPDNPPEFGYYLNIHIDYRYNNGHMKYISQILNHFSEN